MKDILGKEVQRHIGSSVNGKFYILALSSFW